MTPHEDTVQKIHDLSQTEWTDEELAWSHRMARLILGPALPGTCSAAPVEQVDVILSVDPLVKPLDPPV